MKTWQSAICVSLRGSWWDVAEGLPASQSLSTSSAPRMPQQSAALWEGRWASLSDSAGSMWGARFTLSRASPACSLS